MARLLQAVYVRTYDDGRTIKSTWLDYEVNQKDQATFKRKALEMIKDEREKIVEQKKHFTRQHLHK
jgi:hypothetical protein